ncbi:leucine-rich repeat domain-containing protein [uncultured Chryseobacterium sp.]|uniref:leucine-rich repeat domain-containing protein n=1 Tax=uncultured Chryseobacterium sp. TaxID=259322 RepID=UPI0027DB2F50|nr:leucine-rich repeat domain-containing protein [uncultured Chryseobacterium sp.]
MNDSKTIISQLENTLNIKFEKENPKDENLCYISERLSYLTLSNIHLENFSVLKPIFNTLQTLILTECSIADAKDLNLLYWLDHLKMKKCSIFTEDTFDPNIPNAETIPGNFCNISLEDMDVPHPGFFLPVSNYLYNFSFTRCTVGNISELNLFPRLNSLTIEDTRFNESENDIQYQRETKGGLRFLTFDSMKLKNFDFFIPVSKEITILKLYNCELDSLKNIRQFPDLKRLYLDPDLKVNDPNPDYDNSQQFTLKECVIESFVQYYDLTPDFIQPDFDAKLLLSAAPYLRNLTVEGYKLTNTDYLKHLPKLDQLTFEKCTVDLEDYSAVAAQIKKIRFRMTAIKNQNAFRYFIKLKKIDFSVNRYEEQYFVDIEKLLPLKESLKKIILLDTEVIQNIDQITNFTTLEELDISADSIEFAQKILAIESLKNLELNIYIKEQEQEITEPIILDLHHLKNVEKLQLYTNEDFYFRGIGYLKSLKMLILEDDGDLENLAQLPSLKKLIIKVNEIDKLPRLEQVKVLKLYSRGEYCKINLHDKFPNLEKLHLIAWEDQKITISNLEKLKILMFSVSNFNNVIALNNLPHLKKLDLSNCSLSTVSKLEDLSNLKILNLEENQIENIDGLENLKNLERLNLYRNKVSDISVLNKLPRLREANLAGNRIEEEDVEKQLDKPDIATWYFRPFVPFVIEID